MKEILNWFKAFWYSTFYQETHKSLTEEEFKKIWNDNLEKMKIN